MKKIVLILSFLLLSLSIAQADNEADKFCNDAQTWAYFDSVVQQNPDDISLQILHALKIGLCVKIRENSITTNEAIQLFNNMVETAANQRGEEEGGSQKEF